MNCTITRNPKTNQIQKVLDQTGQESRLFRQIASSPIVADTEDALKLFKNVHTAGFDGDETGVEFVYYASGNTYPSYKEALLATPYGIEIQAGFEKGGQFTALRTTKKTTNRDTERGLINYAIQNGLLNEQRMRVGNDYKFISAGETNEKRAVTAEILQQEAYSYLGTSGVKKDFYAFDLQKTKDKIQVITKSGSVELRDKSEIEKMTFEQLQEQFEFPEDIIAGRVWAANRPGQREDKINPERISYRTEDEVQLRLLGFLNKLGVQVTSISNYIKNYKIRNGVNPSAQALADIASKVVAFKDGIINTQDLTEEVAHFIVEAMPAQQTADVLRNIHKSQEWFDFSDSYRKIYESEYSGTELDMIVRKEVLGKILANSLTDNFNTEQKSAQQTGFITKVKQFFEDFFSNVRNYFKNENYGHLAEYLDDAHNLMLRSDLSEESNALQNSTFRYYSVDTNADTPENKLILLSRKMLSQLQDTVQDLRRSGKNGIINRVQQNKLREMHKKMESVMDSESVASLVSVTRGAVNHVQAAVKDSVEKGKNYTLSHDEVNVFNSLMYHLVPTLGQIRAVLIDKKGEEWQDLIPLIDGVLKDVPSLEAVKKNEEAQTVRRLVDEMLRLSGSPESFRQYYEKWIDKADSDVGLASDIFGTLSNSRDGLINLFASQVVNMHHQADAQSFSQIKKLLDAAKKLGFNESEINKFYKEGFVTSEYDFAAYKKDEESAYVAAYKKFVNPDAKLKDKDILARRSKERLTPEQQEQISAALEEFREENSERPRTKEYYEEEKAKWEKAGISEITKQFIKDYRSSLASISAAAKNEKGQTDYSLLSLQDFEDKKRIEQDRSFAKSYVDRSGTLKRGLRYAPGEVDEKGQPIVEPDPTKTLSNKAVIALDLNRLDALNRPSNVDQDGNTIKQPLPAEYLTELKRIDNENGREAAIRFLEMNSFIGFTSDFWNSLDKSNSIVDKLEQVKDGPDKDTIESLIQNIREKKYELKQLLRLWTNKNTPAEIDPMEEAAQKMVRTYTEELTTYYEMARKYTSTISKKEIDEASNIVEGISSANTAYVNELKNKGIYFDTLEDNEPEDSVKEKLGKLAEQVDFAKKHMTEDNKGRVELAKTAIDLYRKGKQNLPKDIKKLANEQGLDLNSPSDYATFMKGYVESKLLQYYKRFTPERYVTFKEDMSGFQGNLADYAEIFQQEQPFIQIVPHYSYFEDNQNATRNPNYDFKAKVGYTRPSRSKYKNKAFYDMFGAGTKTEGSKIVVSTASNQKMAELYNAFLDLRFNSLDAMGMNQTGYNYFTAPQVRKTSLERWRATIGGLSINNLRLAGKDALQFTKEEQIQGDDIGGMGKVIPKMYVNNLDDQEDLATDLLYSSTLFAKEAYLRKSRIESFGTISSIYEKAITRDYNGKDPKATRAYNMLTSAYDYHLYGIKESVTLPVNTAIGTIDIAKATKQFSSFMKFKSLGLNFLVPATGYMTMKSQQFIEKIVGQHVNKRALQLGNQRLKLAEPLKEFGQINQTAEVNVLGQYFGAFHIEEGLRNSQYGFFARLLPRTAFGLFQAAAYPIFSKNLYSILSDFRVIDGKMQTFNNYKAQQRPQGKNLKEIQAQYNKHEDMVLHNFISTKDGQIIFDKDRLGQEMGLSGEALETEVQNISNRVRQAVKNLNMVVDSTLPAEDKTYSQRHFLLNMLMPFRGYIVVAGENRFKKGHVNPLTGQFEIGSYRGFANFIGEAIDEWKQNGHKVIEAFKNVYNGELNMNSQSYADFKESLRNEDGSYPAEDEIKQKYTELTWAEVDARKISLKRIGIDFLFVNTLMAAGLLLRGLADDDEYKDVFAVQLSNLLLYKTTAEVNQSGLAIYRNYADVLEQPIMAYETAKQVANTVRIFSGDETTSEKGLEGLMKLTPGVNTYQKMTHLNDAFNSLRYFQEVRQNTFNYTVPSYVLLNKEEE